MRAQSKLLIVRAERITGEQGPRSYEPGRTCDKCGHRLSIYNATRRCGGCTTKHGPDVRVRMAELMDQSPATKRRRKYARSDEITPRQREALLALLQAKDFRELRDLVISSATITALSRKQLIKRPVGSVGEWELTEAGRQQAIALMS